jgi:hypothetical protein
MSKNQTKKIITTEINSEALYRLDMLNAVCDRFSHSIRTKLGISLGVLDDHLNGYKLETADYQDARDALMGVVSTLNSIKDVTGEPVFHPLYTDLISLLANGQKTRFGFDGSFQIELNTSGIKKLEHPIDSALFDRGFRCLINYLSTRLENLPASLRKISLGLSEINEFGETKLIILCSIPLQDGLVLSKLSEVSSVVELVKLDHRPQSLALFYFEEVVKLHGGTVSITVSEQRGLEFITEFKC